MGAVALGACAPGPQANPGGQPEGEPAAGQLVGLGRTLVISVRVEPNSVAEKPLQQGGVTLGTSQRAFNASLFLLDNQGAYHPYLAESLPQLNSDDWKVFPDGRMESTYRLKPNLVWHDGTTLTAGDYVFSWRVYAMPELGQASSPPLNVMQEVLAPDDRTVVIKWSRPFPEAGVLGEGQGADFPPLPRHILGNAFEEGQWEVFAAHPYWTRDYVGLGPYRLDRWEPGAFIEAVGFDRHVLGRPKIERLRYVFISDANTTLSNLLAGEIHFAADDSIRFEQSRVLRQQWGPTGGTILSKPSLWRAAYFQLRPDLVNPRSLLDKRVRSALAHAVDRQALNEGMYEGEAILADTIIAPSVSYYGEVERAITKYPHDLRRSEQLMGDAGFTKGSDGMYVSSGTGRLAIEAKTNAATQQQQELAILGSGWRQAGLDIQEAILPAAQAQDSQLRASFPAMFIFSSPQGDTALARLNSSGIPRPENRWTGSNRGGWSNPEFDRAADAFTVALDREERVRHGVEMARTFSADLPAISLYFNAIPIAFTSALRGPQDSVPDAEWSWNLHEWELR